MYQHENITLLNCDCMDYMATCERFDLGLVDPEYGIGMDGGNVGYKGNNNFKKKGWDNKRASLNYFTLLRKVTDNQIIWGGNYFADLLPASRCYLVWDKGEGFYNRTYAECELAWTSFDLNTVKFKHDPLANGDYKGKINPCQKPVALYRWIIKNYVKPNQSILDTHGGSMSIAIAVHEANTVEKMNLKLVVCEKDTDYYNDAVKRFKNHISQQKINFPL